jgi:methylmalonyl-CoA mutase N-terminal domain/subunit
MDQNETPKRGGFKNRWVALTAEGLKKVPERKEKFETTSGIEIKRCFDQSDLEVDKWSYEDKLSYPGLYPFTRGVQPTMYRGRLWTMRQYSGFASAAESNRRYKYLLEQGTTGLSIAFDLPTQIGYDSDHPMSHGEVGKVGVAIDSLRDFEVLFDGIPLDKVSTSMTINSTAAILLALYIARAEQTGVAADKLRGTIQNDILKEYVARGTYIFPPPASMRIITNIFEFCHSHVPKWNTISVSGYHIREAGSTAVQEVAFTLANGIAYLEAAKDAGLDIDEIAPRIAFFFNCHNNFLEEIAKFRAARRLWARIVRDRFGAKDPQSMLLRFHTQTAGSTLTAQQPENNVVRVALQALAAVLGGTQSLHTNSLDEALALPTEKTVEIALRTQQIIAYESGVADTVDPLAGSYAIESLTDEIERRADDYIRRIDEIGGAIRAIENGFIQGEIQETAYRYQRSIESGDQVVVGVNRFHDEKPEEKHELLRIDETVEQEKIRELVELRSHRDNGAVGSKLERLKQAAAGEENVMPFILDAVRSYTTLGEISDALRLVFGEHREILTV